MTGGVNWCEFMAVLNRLTAAEVNYFSVSFVERSWSSFRIGRKEVDTVKLAECITLWGEPERVHAYAACMSLIRM